MQSGLPSPTTGQRMGALPLDIVDSSLQNQTTTGALAKYEINNSGKVVTSSSRQVSISDGVTLSLLSADPGKQSASR